MDKKNLDILTNIIGGVETGGQTYGKRNYASYVAPGKNTANEKTCTLGWAGNYGERAKRLCKMILEQNPAAFRKVDTAGIEKKLSVNWETTKWHPTAKEKSCPDCDHHNPYRKRVPGCIIPGTDAGIPEGGRSVRGNRCSVSDDVV